MANIKAYSIKVYGRVQGVGFRYFTRKQAQSLDLRGTVRNHEDGSVEIYACGEEEALLMFIEWCQDGPDTAAVEQVESVHVTVEKHNDFRIVRV